MSELLLNADQWINHLLKQNLGRKSQQASTRNVLKEFQAFDAKLVRSHRQFTQIATVQDWKSKTYSVIFHSLFKKYKGLLSCVYSKQSGKVSFLFQILTNNGKLFRFQTSQMLIEFVKVIHMASKSHQFSLKMMVNYERLEVFFQIVYFSLSESNLAYATESVYKKRNLILQIYNQFIQRHSTVLQKALDMFGQTGNYLQEQQQTKLAQNLYRYAGMMTMKANFSVGSQISEQEKAKLLQQRQQSGRFLQMKKQNIQSKSLKCFQLYGNSKVKLDQKNEKNKNEFYISAAEEKVIKKEIVFQLPQPEQSKSKNFITFLNPIHVHEPQKLVTHPLNSGGFSLLFSSKVDFKFAENMNANAPAQQNPKPIQSRLLAVKKQVKPNGKNLHQARILAQLKTFYAPLLPRYYLPLNIQNHPADKSPLLMMDILIHGNLAEYMQVRNKFSCLNAKLVLMWSITMGLRFLQMFKIVHLDFKPSNIMLSPDLLIKIIDFGEAFHPKVAKKQGDNYKPGITLPYSPPQVSRGKRNQFTAKSDIYSLGVIFYELIFRKRPFENREQLFMVPQYCDNYGDALIIRVLNWMISRCLSQDPNQRPELDWISMILRVCLHLVK